MGDAVRARLGTLIRRGLCLLLAAAVLSVMADTRPASATLFNWPAQWTNPAGSAAWEDWNYNQCGYVTVDGQQWAHLGNDSQGYKSGAVRSIGHGTVRRVINATAPNNGLMVEYQSTAGAFTLSYQHVNPGVSVGASVAPGQEIGTVANWANTSNNHVHVSLIPGAYSSGTSWYGYRNCATGAGSGGGHVNPIPWLAAHGPSGGGASPIGSFDELSSPQPGALRVRGWALDMDAKTTPIAVHVYVGGPAGSGAPGHAFTANTSRPDVGAAYPGVGNNHGFDNVIETNRTGSVPVYVYGINVGGGSNKLISTRNVTIASANPRGQFDSATSTIPGKVRISGWGFDPSVVTTPISMHLYVGGPAGSPGAVGYDIGLANDTRSDVGAAYPGVGNQHGYERHVAIAQSGDLQVYLYGIDLAGTPGDNVLLGSKSVSVQSAPQPMASTALPKISGKARVGKKLSTDGGTWSQPGITLTYQWLRDGRPIKRANKDFYRLRAKDAGHRLRIRITAVKDGYATASALSEKTRKVKG